MPDTPLTPEQVRTAMKDPDHLKRWVQQTRPWIIFHGTHLIDALAWPVEHEMFQQLSDAYRNHRMTIESGETEKVREPHTGEMVDVPKFLTDTLSADEMDSCIRWMVYQLRAIRPDWTL